MVTFELLIDILFLCFATFFLAQGTRILMRSLNELSRSTNVHLFALTGFFSAIVTSLPELVVSVLSSLSGKSNLALGVVWGSNIVDISLVIGLVAIMGGSLPVVADFVKKDVLKAFLGIALPILFLLDGQLSRVDGVVLILAFFVYHLMVFNDKHRYGHEIHSNPYKLIGRWLHVFTKQKSYQSIGWFVIGSVMLLFSADTLVQSGIRIASGLGIPMLMIGLVVLAFGTSIPELLFETQAAKNKRTAVVFGDLLGSLVANSTLILGLAALINPIQILDQPLSITISILCFLVMFFCLWAFVRTQYKLEKKEGWLLVSLYIVFLIFNFGQAI